MCGASREKQQRKESVVGKLGVDGFRQGSRVEFGVLRALSGSSEETGGGEGRKGTRHESLDQGHLGAERSGDPSVQMEPTGVSDG